MVWIIASIVIPLAMGVIMLFVRLKSSSQPTSTKKIILPPLFMSTGLAMFLFPTFHVSWLQVGESLILGMFFSVFLIKTSKFTKKDNEVYLVPSRSFALILTSLFLIRILLKLIIGSKISIGETSGMFYLLALGMIFTWRMAMLIQYKRIARQLKTGA